MKHIIGGNLPPASAETTGVDPANWIAAGREAAKAGRHDEAMAAFQNAIKADPASAAAHFQMGREHYRRGDLALAQVSFERAVQLRPDYTEALNGWGVVCQLTGKWPESEALFRRAIASRPNFAAAMSSLANSLFHRGETLEAESLFRQAIALNDNLMDAHQGLGLLLHGEHRMEEAEQVTRGALATWPESADLQLNLSLLLLATGKYAEAWPLYEARHTSRNGVEVRRQPLPGGVRWSGESLQGRSLHLVSEQGFGDLIQMARYVPALRALGVSRLTVECAAPLRPLLRAVPGIDELVKSAPAHFDYWCFAMSLPRVLQTELHTIPSSLPYLHAPDDRVEFSRALIGPRTPGTLRVGLVWKGNPSNRNDANRSLPSLATLAPLWSVRGVQFVSLQKGAGEEEIVSHSTDQPLIATGSSLRDFADTAAVMGELDLVISVCTATAHLSGALGKSTWVLLTRQGVHWPWGMGRDDTPWYPGAMRLFRQERTGDWAPVIEAVRVALEARVREHRGVPA